MGVLIFGLLLGAGMLLLLKNDPKPEPIVVTKTDEKLLAQMKEIEQKYATLQSEVGKQPLKTEEDLKRERERETEMSGLLKQLGDNQKTLTELQKQLKEKPKKTPEEIEQEKEQAARLQKLEDDRLKMQAELATQKLKNDELAKKLDDASKIEPKKEIVANLPKVEAKIPVPLVPKKRVEPPLLDCTGEKGVDSAKVAKAQIDWAAYLEVEPEISVDLGGNVKMEFVLIPPGIYWRGATENDKDAINSEKPPKKITIKEAFYLAKHEVTRGQFARFVAAENFLTDAEQTDGGWGYDATAKEFKGRDKKYTWKETGWTDKEIDRHPVVNVSWNDCQKFNEWIETKLAAKLPEKFKKVRLPREAEWEYAARAGTRTIYANGDDAELLTQIGNVADATAKEQFPGWSTIKAKDGYVFTAPVGKFDKNAFGVYDMTGNVWEWCNDWYDSKYYEDETIVDPKGPGAGVDRVVRGGSFYSVSIFCRVAFRSLVEPSRRGYNFGFRVVCAR